MIDTYTAIDLETTGVAPSTDRIIEIGMAHITDGVITDTFSSFVNPGIPVSARITEITGITGEDVADAPMIEELIGYVLEYTEGMPLLGHNVSFDYGFIKKAALDNGLGFERCGIDTLKIARRIIPQAQHKNLPALCAYFNIDPGRSHRALDDAISASKLYHAMHSAASDDEGFKKAVPLNYSIKKDTPVTPAQKSFLAALVTYHGIELTQPVEAMTKSQASKMIDEIIATRGRIPRRPVY